MSAILKKSRAAIYTLLHRKILEAIQLALMKSREGYYENYVFYNDRTPGIYCTTNSALTFTCDDYQTAYDSWLKGLVNKYTTSGMSPEEKFYAICQGEFYSGNYTMTK